MLPSQEMAVADDYPTPEKGGITLEEGFADADADTIPGSPTKVEMPPQTPVVPCLTTIKCPMIFPRFQSKSLTNRLKSFKNQSNCPFSTPIRTVAEVPPQKDVVTPARPTPTPCRTLLGGDSTVTDISMEYLIPDISDTTIAKPKAGKMRISAEAVEGRLRRIFTPNIKGEYKVSSEIVQQWRSKKGRKSLEKLFQSVGFSPDWLSKNVDVKNHVINGIPWLKSFHY